MATNTFPSARPISPAGLIGLGRNFAALIPGLLLLAAVGYAGKFIEQSIVAYAKAHHLTFPNIEYVLWAIVIGLVIANTIGVPRIFQAGVATYEFWLKAGIVLLGSRFLLGDVLHLGGISLLLVAIALTLSLTFMHLSAAPSSSNPSSLPCWPLAPPSAESPPSSPPSPPSTPTMRTPPTPSPPYLPWAPSLCSPSRSSATRFTSATRPTACGPAWPSITPPKPPPPELSTPTPPARSPSWPRPPATRSSDS